MAADERMMMKAIVEAVVRLMLTAWLNWRSVAIPQLHFGSNHASLGGKHERCALAQAQNLHRTCALLQRQHGEEMRKPRAPVRLGIPIRPGSYNT